VINKDDFLSRKIRSYLKEHEETSHVWMNYAFVKNSLMFDDFHLPTPNKIEQRAIDLALIDWEEYEQDHEHE
jgi:hypothetical protein